MTYRGDIRLGDTIDIKFTTVDSTGAPATLAGTPVISAYVGNSTTEITAGITLSVDFDGRTGLHNVRVVASGGNGFATATNVQLIITTGTVAGVSVVGYIIGSFSIENRSSLMSTAAGRTLDVAATGEAGLDFDNVLVSGSVSVLGIADQGTLQSATGTTAVLRSALSLADDILNGGFIHIYSGTGAGQSRLIDDFTGATDTVTVSPAWTTNPDNTSKYLIFRTPPASTGALPDVNTSKFGGTTVTGRDLGASVLLSPGTGTGQVDITSGVVKSNMAQILGTALTETAGLLAGGFKKFFNVATPTGTVNSIPDAVAGASNGIAIVGSTMTLTSGERAATADAVWDEAIVGHLSGGTTGAALNAAGSAGDPWTTPVPGAYGAGTAGFIIGGNLDAKVSLVKAKTDNLPAAPAAVADIPSAATIASTVWATVVEGGITAIQMMRGYAAALMGKASGLETTTAVYRDIGDTKDRITATVDEDGNRTSVTRDLT